MLNYQNRQQLPAQNDFFHNFLAYYAVEKEGQAFYLDRERHYGFAALQSALKISGKGLQFTIQALTPFGEKLLPIIEERLATHCALELKSGELIGYFQESRLSPSLATRLKQCPARKVLSQCLFPVEGITFPFYQGGLVGAFAYDIVDTLEKLPPVNADVLQEKDYLFYLPEIFLLYQNQTTELFNLNQTTDLLEKNFATSNVIVSEFECDTSFEAFKEKIESLKKHIYAGDIFQAVLGRMQIADFQGDSLNVFQKLFSTSSSPYCFFLKDSDGAFMGASPEIAVRVEQHEGKRKLSLLPIAGTRPSGISPQADFREQIALRTDPKEVSEHVMLIDLARNDVACCCIPGTTRVEAAFKVKNFGAVQHLVSCVSGEIRAEFSALDTYFATANMGTLTGAPKVRAMQLLRTLETHARGFFGGAFAILSANDTLESCIAIRAARHKNNKIYLRAAAGIVADSVVEREWDETVHKFAAVIKALDTLIVK